MIASAKGRLIRLAGPPENEGGPDVSAINARHSVRRQYGLLVRDARYSFD
jgi:hypothetical protein